MGNKMGIAKIKRITIKKDGVYVYFKTVNDGMTYWSSLCEHLSKVYAAEGQEGLDREVCRIFAEYAEPTPTSSVYHRSILPYVVASGTPEWEALTVAFKKDQADHFDHLSEADKECFRKHDACTEGGRAYFAYTRVRREQLYADQAKLVAEARKKLEQT